jgi:hypothetical protein
MRHLILPGAALLAAITLSPMAAHASATQNATAVAVGKASQSGNHYLLPLGAFSDGYNDARDSCRSADVSDRSDNYQSSYHDGFDTGFSKYCGG